MSPGILVAMVRSTFGGAENFGSFYRVSSFASIGPPSLTAIGKAKEEDKDNNDDQLKWSSDPSGVARDKASHVWPDSDLDSTQARGMKEKNNSKCERRTLLPKVPLAIRASSNMKVLAGVKDLGHRLPRPLTTGSTTT
ncbi:hypothetical protein EMPG_16910, partial [Blastomyces silverae]